MICKTEVIVRAKIQHFATFRRSYMRTLRRTDLPFGLKKTFFGDCVEFLTQVFLERGCHMSVSVGVTASSADTLSQRYVATMLLVCPVQNNFARLPALHQLKALFIFGILKLVRDHWRNIEARLDHSRHFVPCFVHLATIDPFDGQTIEYHQIPVNRCLFGLDTQESDLPAMTHARKHVVQRLVIT